MIKVQSVTFVIGFIVMLIVIPSFAQEAQDEALQAEGLTMYTEDQNSFRVEGKTSIVVSGKADIMAITEVAFVEDCKEQARYQEAEKYLLEALEGRRLKLGDTHPHTLESHNNLIDLYEAWNKPEKAKEWRAKLAKKEAFEE
jgi:hypothetical protein